MRWTLALLPLLLFAADSIAVGSGIRLGSGMSVPSSGGVYIPGGASCPDYPADAQVELNASTLDLANNDPVPSITGTGALAVTLSNGTSSQQPTFKDPCPVGPSGYACIQGDGGDNLAQAVAYSARAQPVTTCDVVGRAVGGTIYYRDGIGVSNRHGLLRTGSVVTGFSGSALPSGVEFGVGEMGWACVTYNNTSGSITVNGTNATGAIGTQTPTGHTLMSAYDGSLKSQVYWWRTVSFDGAVSHDDVESRFDCDFGGGGSWPR